MVKEIKTETKVGVGIAALWKALSKDLRFLAPKIAPNLIKDVELIEGDGTSTGTVLLFSFGTDASNIVYQEEKIVELDESLHRFGLQVLKGGHLNHGFSSYKTSFQLAGIQEQETLVSITVTYESAVEDTTMPSKSTQASIAFIKSLESYLLNAAA
ncbi:PREDICTED: phytohormone-binding protein-like [Fragaria vesca subsp. vesca]|uniref:phytohormone-binding protein-like n=1 Tax=Fragaria vesca subsp. vesca TaxID=101020 RepID=UPI0002C3404C|nr:PREDICTED: phytohormone-binding protein-like [Fragaria vesca subsp. vesca]